MFSRIFLSRSLSLLSLLLGLTFAGASHSTTVIVQTSEGNFTINLLDFDADIEPTVQNFLQYVNGGFYDNTYFHRLASGFVIQGGGFVYDGNMPEPQSNDALDLPGVELVAGEANPTVDNAAKYSNVRGTVAMAKLGGDPNSATNQWFVNLNNNGGNLDGQNGGFTVFGVVTQGMDVVDALAGYTLMVVPSSVDPDTNYVYPSPLGELPLTGYTQENFTDNVIPNNTNLAYVTSISVDDSTVDTASGLDLIINEIILGVGTPTIDREFKDNGAVGWLGVIGLVVFALVRRWKIK